MPSRDYCVGLISGVVNPDPSEKNPPREQPVPEQAPPIPRAVLVPELEQPLISDHERRLSLYNRLCFYYIEIRRPYRLRDFFEILELQVQIERRVEAALVHDGVDPGALFAYRNHIRQYLLGEARSPRPYLYYLRQIEENGTRASVPYLRVQRARRNLNLLF